MQSKMTLLKVSLAATAILALSQAAHANVWMDEDFEGASAFVQGTTLDPYSTNSLANPVSAVMTHTGSVSSSKSFQGLKGYELSTGETLAVAEPYQDQANGNFQTFQFAVNVDPIPAAGTVGTFRWNFDSDSTTGANIDHSYYVRMVSTGTTVNLIGGEDVANVVPVESTIGTLTSSSDWKYVTLLMQKDGAAHTDSRPTAATGSIAQGLHFFVSSYTQSSAIGFLGSAPTSFMSRSWSFTVNSGTVYLDNLYWDGGMEDDGSHFPNAYNSTTSPASVQDWSFYN